MKLKRSIISLVIAVQLTVSFLPANFALAQEGAPPPPPSLPVTTTPTVPTVPNTINGLTPPPATENIILTKAELAAAHLSPEACYQFRLKVFNATGGEFKAFTNASLASKNKGLSVAAQPGTGQNGRCYIVPASFADYDVVGRPNVKVGNSNLQPVFAREFQNKIASSETGISQADITEAKAEKLEAELNAGKVSRVIGFVINSIFSAISSFFSMITAYVGEFMVVIIGLTTESTSPNIVNVGWAILRDFANMFFILIMIVMGLAAILRLEQYDYKHLLGEVIIMAILVNFSKVIAETIINFSNFLVALFAFNDFYQIYDFLQKVSWGGTGDLTSGGWVSGLIQGLTKLVFNVITFGVFLILTGMFTIRLVGLYILVIFSPMAYILDILPSTKNLAHDWWHKFIEYVIWAPVAMFVIRLAVLIVEGGGLDSGLTGAARDASALGGPSNDSIFNYIIMSGFMIAAVLIAEHAGMVGGKAIVNGVEKGMHKGFHMGGEFLARAYTKKVTQKARQASLAGNTKRAALYKAAGFLNPIVAKKAWDQRSHHIEEEVYEPAIGYAHDTLNRVMPTEWHKNHKTGLMGLGRKTNFGDIEYNRVINKKTKEYNEAPLTEEQRVQLYVDATHLDDKVALLRSIVLNRHEDGLAGAWGVAYDSTDFKKRIFDDLQHAGASSEEIGQLMNYVSEISEEGRKIRGMGSGVVDKDGVARAAADLVWFDDKNKSTDEDMVAELKKLHVIDEDGKFTDKFGETVQVDGQDVVIRNREDYKKAIESTANLDDAKGHVLGNEVIAARSAREAIKRLKRTDSEDVAKALEPAAVAVQEMDGSYSRLHSEGRRILEMLNPSVGAAVPGMRRTQARFQAIVGGSEGPDGTIDYSLVLENETKFNLLVEAAHESPEIAAGFLSKAKMSPALAGQIIERVNHALDTKYKGKKQTDKRLKYNPNNKDGGFEVKLKNEPTAPAPTTPPTEGRIRDSYSMFE